MSVDEPHDALTQHGAHVMTVCNACRYCEHYCPVFPAMEQRLIFHKADLAYLANLCHNCGECLYACQYAPPHEFGIDVPQTLARIRHRSYEDYAWPRWLVSAFRRQGALTALLLAAALTAALFAATLATNPRALWQPGIDGDFYRVVPHTAMVTLFGAVALAVCAALAIGGVRCWHDIGRETDVGAASPPAHAGAAFRWPDSHVGAAFPPAPVGADSRLPRPDSRLSARGAFRQTLQDALSLRHLHGAGTDCVNSEERRTPWRRRWHHSTFYGFVSCVASTSVAAIYHASGSAAPYAYTSVPVVLGTIGGLGLLIGPVGLWCLRRRSDPDLRDPDRAGLDDSFLVLLFVTSLTGLLLMVLRSRPAMSVLLIVHLGTVLALFLTLPYGKFVHGLYRTLALLKFRREAE